MKLITYLPGTQASVPRRDDHEALCFEALARFVFESPTLEDAVQEIQREGCAGPDGARLFRGIKDLLEDVRAVEAEMLAGILRDQSCRQHISSAAQRHLQDFMESLPSPEESSGAVKSGRPLHRSALQACARFVQEQCSADGFFLATPEARRFREKSEKLAALETGLRRARWGFDCAGIDERLLEDMLGARAREDWLRIKGLTGLLVESRCAERSPAAGLQLTSRGLQKIALSILREIFSSLPTVAPARRRSADVATEPYLIEGTRPFQFGDHLHIDTSRSLLNALRRTGAAAPLRLAESDFEVYQKEPVTRNATVVLIDMSKSMRFEQRFVAAKKVALALMALIRLRYPQDRVEALCFSTKTRPVAEAELPFLAWNEQDPYTNMEEALWKAQTLLSGHKSCRRQVFLITDGEPTAHRENGALFFQFPPHPATLEKTVRALDGLVRAHIALSIFLLAQEKDSIAFMQAMARRSQGRLFHIHPADLGRCLLMDYVVRKQKYL